MPVRMHFHVSSAKHCSMGVTHDEHIAMRCNRKVGMSVAMSAAQVRSDAIGNALGICFNPYSLTPERILNAVEDKKERLPAVRHFKSAVPIRTESDS